MNLTILPQELIGSSWDNQPFVRFQWLLSDFDIFIGIFMKLRTSVVRFHEGMPKMHKIWGGGVSLSFNNSFKKNTFWWGNKDLRLEQLLWHLQLLAKGSFPILEKGCRFFISKKSAFNWMAICKWCTSMPHILPLAFLCCWSNLSSFCLCECFWPSG